MSIFKTFLLWSLSESQIIDQIGLSLFALEANWENRKWQSCDPEILQPLLIHASCQMPKWQSHDL